VILAELEIWHSRPIAPTRRVAIGDQDLPCDPPPGYGGILLAGIVAVLLMGLGTAITVSVLAAIAVYAKDVARRLAGGSGVFANALVWWAELAGAVIVFAFGVVMVLASLS